MTSRMPSRGFSLIEVVAALAILALALGALYRLLSTAARQASLAQHYTAAVSIAETKLVEAGADAGLARGSDAGLTERRFHWLRSVQPYSSADERPDPQADLLRFRITVEVRWDHDGAPHSVVLTTVRLRRAT